MPKQLEKMSASKGVDRQNLYLTGHCLLTGCYFKPQVKSLVEPKGLQGDKAYLSLKNMK